jgi:hypothetical protein
MKIKNKVLISSLLLLTVISCSNPNITSLSDSSNTITKASLGPTGGGTIDPKITSGQTLLNYKRGFNSLVLNIKLSSSSSFSTKDTSTATTTSNDVTKTDATKATDATTKSEDTVEKVTTELKVNGEEIKFEIPKDKFTDNQHKINVTGLKEGDIVNAESRVYDTNGKIVGSENVKDKKIEKEFESIDFNITLSINISNTNTQNVNVTQNQTVTGPNITINLTPPANPNQPVQSQQTNTPKTSSIPSDCLTPTMPDHKVTFKNGSSALICPKPELRGSNFDITSCLQPDQNFKVTLKDGTVATICPPPIN